MADDQGLTAVRLSDPAGGAESRSASGASPSHDNPPAVSVRDVTRSFGEVAALAGVSLDARPGEFVSILGPSGCGKTTLLRIIGGFESADSGTVEIGGRDMSRVEPNRRPANMVFQRYALFPHMTVAQNIAFGPQLRRQPSEQIGTRIEALLKLVRLEGYGERRPSQLSGGQAQRVALARALANDPVVLLLDEPLAALDLKLRQAMRLELRDIQTEVGSTFIYVTHDQEDALTTSDRIVLMNDGVIEQVGSPEEVYARPRTRFVAEFIGDSNLIEGEIVACGPAPDGGEGLRALVRRGEAVLAAEAARAAASGTRAWVCVRPEVAEITPAGDRPGPDAAPQLTGTVEKRVFLGSAVRYLIRHDDGPPFLAQAEGGRRRRSYAEGERVQVGWDDSAATIVWD